MNEALATLWRELLDGPPGTECYVLNPGDPGVLRSLDRLTAAEASRIPPGHTASIAAHVDHLRYGLNLGNRWRRGEPNPFATANFSESWRRTTVDDGQWSELRASLRKEVDDWRAAFAEEIPDHPIAKIGYVSLIVHLAYHLGAMRQIAPGLRGPRATD